MADLSWFRVVPPREIDINALVSAVRVLASRPRIGFMGRTPMVVFELWGVAGEIRWLLGVDGRMAAEIAQQLTAHVPRLGLVPRDVPDRPAVEVVAEFRQRGFAHPLRMDMAEEVAKAVQDTLRSLGPSEAAVVQWTLGPAQNRARQPRPFDPMESVGLLEKRKPDAIARRSWQAKAEEPLFAVRGRIGATSADRGQGRGIVRRLAGGIALANSPHANLTVRRPSADQAVALNQARMPYTWSCLLSASEIATLLGWPVQVEIADDLPVTGGYINMVPAPLLGDESDGDEHSAQRVLGESLHPAQRSQLVTMPSRSGPYHLHLIGPTGSGKSTLLTHLILADVTAGRGVLVIEPRGDLIEDLLCRLPENRRDDVVVIDPADAATHGVVGLNVLAGPIETAERRADELVSLLAAMAGSNWGPRTGDVALHAVLTASRLRDGTLPDVVALLTNPAFRRRVIGQVADPLVLGPWWSAFDALSEGERAQHVSPLLNKLRPFMSRNAIRQMLGQPQSRFSFDDLFASRRIVLVNLNRGLLGGPAANLLGALVLSQVWSALQRRASLPREKRAITGLYVDEFQDYVDVIGGLDFGDALAQSRGLGGAWTVAHQHFAQLSPKLEAAVIANARSRISFRPGPDDARALAKSFASTMTGEDLLRLGAYEAVVQIHLSGKPTEPFAVRTRPLGRWLTDAEQLRLESAKRYGADGAAIDDALAARWNSQDLNMDGPIGTKQRSRV